MWEVIKDLIKFIAQLLAKRKATFEAVVRCKYTMNSKGKQQSQFTLILQNVGKGDAKNIEISSDDIYLIFNKHFDIVSTGKAIQSPISLVISNPPQIRNLIGCSGTMPEKLQGSFPIHVFVQKKRAQTQNPLTP